MLRADGCLDTMNVHPTDLEGLMLIELETFDDSRGLFRETYRRDEYGSAGINDVFVQDSHSHSSAGVLRGLHFRLRQPQAQIVTVMRGQIFDVVVDIRPHSPTFGHWFGTELREDGCQQIYMASGFAHGFCVLSEAADLHYKVTQVFDETDEWGILWSDPDLGISWPVRKPVISSRDAEHARWADVVEKLRTSANLGRIDLG